MTDRDSEYDPEAIEGKWRRRWREEGRYEADAPAGDDGDASGDPEETTFVTVPYPYPSGGMHVGHARTYLVPDAFARYRRLRGDDVLFPMAWHYTGTPIVGAVERLKEGDPDQRSTLTDAFGVPESDLQRLETPEAYARYFAKEADASYRRGMEALGLSIDWRREFTTNDRRYSTFVEWQYRTLRERGLLEKGLHPTNYCTNEQQPVTTHDLLEGEDAEFQEFTLVRFRIADGPDEGAVAPMATLRPETVRGVTNAFVDPEAEYVRATVDGERWVASAAAARKFELQGREVTVEERFEGRRLVGRSVTNPVTDESVPVLPAGFVDADDATGVVMSVPAHSPDDYVALREIKANPGQLEEYGVDPAVVADVEPVPILEIEGYGEVPAREAVEAAGIDSSEDPRLHEVTEELYREEFHHGRLLSSYGDFAGEVIEDVRERFREHHSGEAFDRMYEFTEEVVCRCGGDVEVANQETWFLRYNDDDWRAKAREAVERLDAVPENTREQYEHTIGWLEEWPCIRNYGLGTRLPWDDEFVIEPLSDSTIYMSYYTVAHRIDEVPVEALDDDFFDALLLGAEDWEPADYAHLADDGDAGDGEGDGTAGGDGDDGDADPTVDPDGVSGSSADLPFPTPYELRREFEHWYPVDVRFSANDLVNNHLTFFLYHHAELFERDHWPRGITVMGMGLKEGEKMSSSKGNVDLPGEVIERFGTDTVRFFMLNSVEPWQDYDWRGDAVAATRDAIERFWRQSVADADDAVPDERPDLAAIDRWLLSKLQSTVRTVTEALDDHETRTASQAAFYDFADHLRWYRRRTDTDRPAARWTLARVLETRLALLAPFVPFLANELHERLTGDPVEAAGWPAVDDELVAPDVELAESLVRELTEDVADIVEVTGTDPDHVSVYVAADWKRRVLDSVVDHAPTPDRGAVMSDVMSDPDLRERGDAVNDLVGDLVELVRETRDDDLERLVDLDERAVYERAADFLARERDATVEVYHEDDDPPDPGETADQAVPFRPAIHLE